MAIHVKFSGIDGECQLKGFTTYSEVESFEIGAEKTVEGATGQARRRGDVKLGDVTITKNLDSTAPSMFLATAMSHVFPTVLVVFTENFTQQVDAANNATGSKNVFMEILMEDVLLSNYNISGAGGDDASFTETVILNYTRITYRYRLVNKSGGTAKAASTQIQGAKSTGGLVIGGWDSEVSKEYVSPLF